MNMTNNDLKEMREWLEGFSYDGGLTGSDCSKLSDDEVIEQINELYEGGVEQFIKDGDGYGFLQ